MKSAIKTLRVSLFSFVLIGWIATAGCEYAGLVMGIIGMAGSIATFDANNPNAAQPLIASTMQLGQGLDQAGGAIVRGEQRAEILFGYHTSVFYGGPQYLLGD